MVGKLNLSLYGTRDAALNRASEYTSYLKSMGFIQGLAWCAHAIPDARPRSSA